MLLSRALSLATVMLLVGCCTMGQVEAQENLEAGKSPSQIFASTCTACHKSPRGLLKKLPPGSLTAFLRQHYTTSSQMAGVLASYLISNGATDTRYGGGAKGRKDAKSGAKPASASEVPAALGELGHPGQNKKRLARPAEAPDAVKPAAEGQAPTEEATELSAQQRPGKHVKPGPEEAPMPAEPPKEEASGGEPSKTETKVESKQESEDEAAKAETGQPEGGKPAEDPSQSANAEPAKMEALAPRPDSVPVVTPAPTVPASPATSASPASAAGNSGSEPAAPPAVTAPASPAASTSPVSAAAGISGSEPAVATPAVAPELSASPPPTVTASAPPQPPVAPAGPPAPPISK